MAERYNIRNVAQRQIYDSYMGILRISPNLLNGNQLEDDPTELLNDTSNEKGVILSDSDGNELPITFIPKEFNGKINLQTKVNGDIFASKTIKIKNTLKVNGNLTIYSGIKNTRSLENNSGKLIYPRNTPFDESYFNTKDKYNFYTNSNGHFNKEIPRKQLVEKELLNKSKNWYDTEIDTNKIVSIDGSIVTTSNDGVRTSNEEGEQIPVLYTNDYILGHKEGGNIRKKFPNSNDEIIETSLEWIRIDKLVWDCLREILDGAVRHSDEIALGRYKGLGVKCNESLVDTIFNVYSQTNKGGKKLTDKAPILGTSIPRGLIMYHSMNFNRYMFHCCRQIQRNRKTYGTLTTEPNIWKQLRLYSTSSQQPKISPCVAHTNGFIHSLCKDFVLCNGLTVQFNNFPNLNITNMSLFDFDTNDKGSFIKDPSKLKKLNPEKPKTSLDAIATPSQSDDTTSSTINQSDSSNTKDITLIKLPQLFSLKESAGRFIRGDFRTKSDERYGTTLYSCNYRFPKEDNHYHLMFSSLAGGYLSSGFKKDAQTVTATYHCRDAGETAREKIFNSKSLTNNKTFSYDFINPFYSKTSIGYTKHVKPFSYIDARGGVRDKSFTEHTDFLNYCLKDIWEGGLFHNYTPIPNIGLYIFNAGIFNKITPTTSHQLSDAGIKKYKTYLDKIDQNHYKYQGTLKQIQDNLQNYYYYDGEGVKHKLNGESDNNTKSTPKDNTNDSQKDKLNKRMFMALKMNQAQGFIPISAYGYAQYRTQYSWSVSRRSGWGKKQRQTHTYQRGCIAGYGLVAPQQKKTGENYYNFCVTSIPYENPYKLGVGQPNNFKLSFLDGETSDYNVTDDTPENYYDNNSVTYDFKKSKGLTYSFGGIDYGDKTFTNKTNQTEKNTKIQTEEDTKIKNTKLNVMSGIPSPPFMNLLPLMRI